MGNVGLANEERQHGRSDDYYQLGYSGALKHHWPATPKRGRKVDIWEELYWSRRLKQYVAAAAALVRRFDASPVPL